MSLENKKAKQQKNKQYKKVIKTFILSTLIFV